MWEILNVLRRLHRGEPHASISRATSTRARHSNGSAVSVPAVGPSDLSERYVTVVAARLEVSRSRATGFRAQSRARRVAKARSSSGIHTAVQLGGYRVQGKTLAAAEQLVDDALALQEAGALALLLEALPSETAAFIRERLDVLVYGIGAGPHTDGQLVISHDILGNFVGEIRPRFVRRYADVDVCVTEAFRRYAEDVRAGAFPGPEHCYPIDAAEEGTIRQMRGKSAIFLYAQRPLADDRAHRTTEQPGSGRGADGRHCG